MCTAQAQLISAASARHGPCAGERAAAVCRHILQHTTTTSSSSSSSSQAAPAVAGRPAEPALPSQVQAALLCVRHDRALAHGDLAAARLLVSELSALCSSPGAGSGSGGGGSGGGGLLGGFGGGGASEVRAEAERRRVLNLMAAGALPEAHQVATDLFASCTAIGRLTLQVPCQVARYPTRLWLCIIMVMGGHRTST